MPKKKQHKNNSNDFTIKDYADSSVVSSRPKKSVINSTIIVPQMDNMLLSGDDDRNWDDSDDELDSIKYEQQDITSCKQKAEEWDKSPGIVYPLAIWFLISEFIPPEDVGRFAGICKSSHYTTTFAKFWNDLYKKYCKPKKSNLPDHLLPECLNRRHGLRSLVIRSLYHVYGPLVSRPPSNQFCTPEQLLKCRCASIWFKRVKDRWCVYFKMLMFNCVAKKPSKNLMDLLDDVHANSQEGYKVLEVPCSSFTDCTSAMGLILTVIKASIGMNMISHRLTLGFSTSLHAQSTCTVMLDNVGNTQVYDWWHPKYPHPGENLPASTVSCPNKFNSPIDSVEP